MVNGVVVGSIYALAALGFVLIYKASRVINFAHGDFLALGAFVALAFSDTLRLPFGLAVLATLAVFFLMGLGVERAVLRPLIGKEIIAVIMVTIGLSSILKGLMYLGWGAGYFVFPPFLPDEPIVVGGVYLSTLHLAALAASALFLVVFNLFFSRSTLGISMRAVADDQQAALSLGVSVRRIFGISWAIALVAAVAAGIVVGSITSLSTEGLSAIGILVFPAAIVGGLDSVPGAVVGGLLIGILENLSAGYLSPLLGVGVQQVVPFVVLVLILMVKPYGLFGTVEIERV
ncbi:ABC transporter permease [Limnochorda pilosa]|uniref:ABC transporter permease n=1 Tax=Limnochorda pilosa TaxID=1555112 RepID=A0A0K2SIT0_LIMPI|nr:ABC transporter permease [Limnochorda pilosa]